MCASELRMGSVVIVLWESGRGTWDTVWGLGLGRLGLELVLGSGLEAISSSEDVMLITSDSGTGFGFGFGLGLGFFGFVFGGWLLLDLALVFRERIFARSAREGGYIF